MRQLQDRSKTEYQAVLRLARDADGKIDAEKVARWSKGRLIVLRAALRREFFEKAGVEVLEDLAPDDAKRLRDLFRGIPHPSDRRRVIPLGLTEAEAQSFEQAAATILEPGRKAVLLVALFLGLRAEELLSLNREQVKKAIKGELIFVRKGGDEHRLEVVESARPLFAALLKSRARNTREPWETVGQILSAKKSAYRAYNRLVHQVGRRAQIERLHPHRLRHGFASRMGRDGATLPAIQWALGHRHMSTTMLYVHGDAASAAEHMRGPTPQT